MDPQFIDTRYYFVRRLNGQPVGCVCLGETSDGVYCRGVSICSDEDSFNKKYARSLALARARKACGTKTTSMPLCLSIHCRGRKDVDPHKSSVMFLSIMRNDYISPVTDKSCYNAVLSDYEKRIFDDPPKKS